MIETLNGGDMESNYIWLIVGCVFALIIYLTQLRYTIDKMHNELMRISTELHMSNIHLKQIQDDGITYRPDLPIKLREVRNKEKAERIRAELEADKELKDIEKEIDKENEEGR